jgi:hypothetical protein
MRKSHLALAAVGLTGAVVTGSAMTAENTIDDTIAGYGESAITGAAVTEIDYVTLASDSTYLDEVVFTTTTQLDLTPGTGNTATMTLKDGGAPLGDPVVCDIATWASSAHVITCDTPDTTQFSLVDAVGLTVAD